MILQRRIDIAANEAPLENVPADILEILSDLEKDAYSRGAAFFKDVASKVAEPVIGQLLGQLDDGHYMRVYLEKRDEKPWICWFGFTFMPHGTHLRFRPTPVGVDLPSGMPERLREIYSHFGGINVLEECDNGLLPPEEFKRAADSGYDYFMSKYSDVAQKCWKFYEECNGDYTSWHEDGRAFSLNHEEECFEERDLDAFLDRYFEGLLRPEY